MFYRGHAGDTRELLQAHIHPHINTIFYNAITHVVICVLSTVCMCDQWSVSEAGCMYYTMVSVGLQEISEVVSSTAQGPIGPRAVLLTTEGNRVTPQKPWFNQFVAHLHFVPCIWKGFVWEILGILSGAAARVTVTWTVAGYPCWEDCLHTIL